MCSSSDDVDDEDCENMENTMCSSHDDVDDENYMEKQKNVIVANISWSVWVLRYHEP